MSVYKGLKYYKYQSWTQPTLTANGTVGGSSFAVNASSEYNDASRAYFAFNSGSTQYWHSNSGHPQWIGWYNPNPLHITNIKVKNRNSDGSYIKDYTVLCSNDNDNFIEVASGTSPNQSAYAEWNIAISETNSYKYWRLNCTSSSGNNSSYTAVQQITITATELVAGTPSSYDYLEPQKISEIYKGLKYYKYQNWTQPILSSNTTAVIEGNIVVSASSNYSGEDPWRALDGNNSGTSFAFNSVPTGWWQVKFPYKLRITGLTFCQRENAGSYRTNTARFYTSSDKSTPIGNEFNPPATSYAQTVVSGIPSAGIITDTIYLDVTDGLTSAGMSELIITAQKVIAGTSSSYDYSEPQKIAKIYKGSELVYSSISGPRFQLYGYSGNASDHFGVSKTFLIGGMTLGNPYCNNFIPNTYGEYSFWAAIKNITGTLGESGSTITYRAENFPNDVTFNYYNTYQVNGITLYFYLNSDSTYEGSWVMEGSTIGSICLDIKLANSYSFGYPTAASESSCTTYVYNGQYTFTRDSSLDCIWTLEGIR